MVDSIPILAYLGPETMLPMTSIVAGVVGVVMMFGRNSFRWVANGCRAILGRTKGPALGSKTPRRIGTGPVGGIVRDHASEHAEVEN